MACASLLLTAGAASAKPVKLVVDSPSSGETVTNSLAIRAHLDAPKRSRVKKVHFYVEGKLVAVDTKAPFSTSRSSAFNTNELPAGSNRLKLSATYFRRGSGGSLTERTLSRSIRVEVFRPPSEIQPLPAKSWKQVFSDDFSSPSASRGRWETQRDDWIKGGIPYSNLEGAGYLSSNVHFAGGTMNISTSGRSAAGFGQSTGSVNTHGAFSFKYGYIEARILVPPCAGCWPAFWMLPRADHWPPEIDIIEYFDTSKQVIPYSAVHWPANTPKRERYFSERLMRSDQDNYIGSWHTYGALWTRNTVQFYIDGFAGPQFSRPSRIPHKAMYPIIQLAVGRGHHPKAGSTLRVDQVRVWQRSG